MGKRKQGKYQYRVSGIWNVVQHCSTLFNNIITSFNTFYISRELMTKQLASTVLLALVLLGAVVVVSTFTVQQADAGIIWGQPNTIKDNGANGLLFPSGIPGVK
jgi:hypothetical protein